MSIILSKTQWINIYFPSWGQKVPSGVQLRLYVLPSVRLSVRITFWRSNRVDRNFAQRSIL